MRRTRTATEFAMTATLAWARRTNAGFATVRAPSTDVVALTSLKALAIVQATWKSSLGCEVEDAQLTKTATAFVTTWTTAWVNTTAAVCATVLALS